MGYGDAAIAPRPERRSLQSCMLCAPLLDEPDETLKNFRTIVASISESGFDVEPVVIEFAKGDSVEARLREGPGGERNSEALCDKLHTLQSGRHGLDNFRCIMRIRAGRKKLIMKRRIQVAREPDDRLGADVINRNGIPSLQPMTLPEGNEESLSP
jgi:hypothetical protein